jgi:hypothetical protein
MVMRDEAGPQLSPDMVVQSASLQQRFWACRHMVEKPVKVVRLQVSPLVPGRHMLVLGPEHGLGLGTQAFFCTHWLSLYLMVQAWLGRMQ